MENGDNKIITSTADGKPAVSRSQRQKDMRIIGELDCALTALEYQELFRNMGYKHILVYVVKKQGTVDIVILGGRKRPPTKAQIQKFNSMKILGVCYTVSRELFLPVIQRPIRLWSNKRWDVD